MSNWAVVMVCWSGVDRPAGPAAARARAIEDGLAAFGNSRMGWRHLPGCSEDSVGPACEEVLFGNVCHFDIHEMLAVLRGMEWGYPEEVQVLYKTEDDKRYRVVGMVEGVYVRNPFTDSAEGGGGGA